MASRKFQITPVASIIFPEQHWSDMSEVKAYSRHSLPATSMRANSEHGQATLRTEMEQEL